MSRVGRRVSRPLIVVLILMLLMGAISILQKNNRAPVSAASAQPVAPDAKAQATATDHPLAKASDSDVIADAAATQPAPDAISVSAVIPQGPVIPADPISPANPVQDAVLVSQRTSSSTTMPSGGLISQAQASIDGGRLLEARAQLNDALRSGQLDASQSTSVKAMISQISQTVVFGHQHFANDPYGGTYVVQSGDSLSKVANAHDLTWEFLSRINGIEPKNLRAGATIKVAQGPFFAVIDKTKFMMDIYLGGLPGEASSMYVTSYPVGLGKDDSTPAGTWIVQPQKKLKHPTYYSPRGEGVIAADDPKNPLGGFWIGLSGTDGEAVGKLSYGIHGTIDPQSIGKQSSMGCIRLKPDDITMVFDLMVEGKSIVVVKE